jgi:hypothetical protein
VAVAAAVTELIDEVVAATSLGCSAVAVPLANLIERLPADLPLADARRLLDTLRGRRCFGALETATSAMLSAGIKYAYVRRQHAQALIERGALDEATRSLEALIADLPDKEKKERSEGWGLLGRAYKQAFVNNIGSDREAATQALNRSVESYATVYELDPAWHGANLGALLHRDEEEVITLQGGQTSAAAAKRLLEDLDDTRDAWGPWTLAGVGEAYLAQENWKQAEACFGRYAQSPGVSGFALEGTVRQLREIWAIAPHGTEPPGSILMALQARVLATGSGTLGSSPHELAVLKTALETADPSQGRYQAILGQNPLVQLRTMLTLVSVAGLVCRVVDRIEEEAERKSGGTGFLVDGGAFKKEWTGRTLILTNHHVLSKEGGGGDGVYEPNSIAVRNANAVFEFLGGDLKRQPFECDEILASSPREEADFTLASIRNGPAIPSPIDLNLETDALQAPGNRPRDRVHVVGHPDGRKIEFSMSDNEVVDHELGDANPPRGHRRIHYRAGTEGGMSGSPVIDARRGKIVGLHHKGNVRPLRPAVAADAYPANEAIWIKSVLEALT